jgi:hypothetical protein
MTGPVVVPALVAGIHVQRRTITWMAGTSPAMTFSLNDARYG